MLQVKRNRSGFTLIELLIVVIIVAVLAAVGMPLLSANVQRARNSEADAGLGTVRTAMRASLAQNGSYPAAGTVSSAGIGIGTTDLDGHYFSTAVYTISANPRTKGGNIQTNSFCAGVDGTSASNTAVKASQVNTVKRSIDENGTIYDAAIDCSGTILN